MARQGTLGEVLVSLIVIGGVIAYLNRDSSPTIHKMLSDTGVYTTEVPSPIVYRQPVDQKSFISIVDGARSQYRSSENDMAKGSSRITRRKALCSNFLSPNIRQWVGVITELSSNSDGNGVLSVRIGDKISVKTWNNAFSDIGSGTLINSDSSMYALIKSMKVGDSVIFSGSFIEGNKDCFGEQSLTLDGSMTEPEFTFKFQTVSPLKS